MTPAGSAVQQGPAGDVQPDHSPAHAPSAPVERHGVGRHASATTRPSSKTSTRSNPSSRSRSWVTSRPAVAARRPRGRPGGVAQVEQSGRLVEHQQVGLGDQHRGQREQLLLPARTTGARGGRRARQTGPIQAPRDSRPGLRGLVLTAPARSPNATSSATVGITICASGSVKQKPTRRRIARASRAVSSPSTRTVPTLGTTSAVQQPGERRLPRPVRADHADRAAR